MLLPLVLLMALLVYWPGLSGPFVLDDVPNIIAVYIAEPDLDSVIYNVTHNESGRLGRSISVLSFVLTGLIYGIEPWGYKFHNLILHLCNGALIFWLVRMLVPALKPDVPRARLLLLCGSLTAFWLLHPLQVSTVLYVVQRMTQLSAFFSLLALVVYVAARRNLTGERYFLLAWVLFPLSMVLALLSKETGALIPLYVLTIELFVFRGRPADWREPRLGYFIAVFAILPLVVGGLYALINLDSLTDYSMRSFTLQERLLTQLHVVAQYARLILLPRLRDMGLYHDDFPITHEMDTATLALLLLLIAVCCAIWLCRRKAPVVAFGLAWFLVSHLLESTFIPLEMVFEHRNYLAVFGLLLPPLYYLFTAPRPQALQLAMLTYLALMTFQTGSRVLEWSDEQMLVSVAVEDHPNSARARTFLANYEYGRRNVDGALEHLRVAETLRPDDAGASIHILGIQCREGQRDERALAEARRRLLEYPATVYVFNGLENILVWRGKNECLVVTPEDIESLVLAALSQPDNIADLDAQGFLLRLRGIVNITLRRYAAGVIDFRMAYDLAGMPEIIGDLVNYQVGLQRFDDAEDTLAFLREVNESTYGTNTHLVEKHTKQLAQARARMAEQAAAGIAGEEANGGDASTAQPLDNTR